MTSFQTIKLSSGIPMHNLADYIDQISLEGIQGDIILDCQDTQYCHAAVLQWFLALHLYLMQQRKRLILRHVTAELQQDMAACGLDLACE